MSFDWQNFFYLAKYLFENADRFPDQEACYRSAASRAYYAVFCLARNYIKHADGISIEWHQEIQDHLKKDHNNRTRCRIGNQLKRLHQVRKKADYENDLKELPFNTASKALSQAEKILDGIKKLQQH